MGTDHAAGILAKQKRKTRNGNMSFISTLNLPKITNSKKKVHFLCMTYTIFYLVVAFNIIIQIFVRDYLGLIFLSLSILHFKLISEYAMNVTVSWGGGGGGIVTVECWYMASAIHFYNFCLQQTVVYRNIILWHLKVRRETLQYEKMIQCWIIFPQDLEFISI